MKLQFDFDGEDELDILIHCTVQKSEAR